MNRFLCFFGAYNIPFLNPVVLVLIVKQVTIRPGPVFTDWNSTINYTLVAHGISFLSPAISLTSSSDSEALVDAHMSIFCNWVTR